jgi:hypothetical protein
MRIYTLLLIFFAMTAHGASIEGRVVDSSGRGISDARVFVEMGLAGLLVETRSAADGAFSFPKVRPTNMANLFAIKEGFSFGGKSEPVAIAAEIRGVEIPLGQPGSVSGRISNDLGDTLATALIVRVAVPGDTPYSIPFGRLGKYGIPIPSSRDDGSFTVPNLPAGAEIILKVRDSKGQYAQGVARGFRVGERDARVMLSSGVLVAGDVFSQSSDIAVRNTTIIATRTDPHETIVTQTDVNGSFMLHMVPGVYSFQAQGAAFRSPSGITKVITGESLIETIHLTVAGMGRLRGRVLDAVSEKPIEGARVFVTVNGILADIGRTGPTGTYELNAAEGENAVTLEEAPGFTLHESRILKFQVAGGELKNVPTFWLKPLPTYSLLVFDEAEAPLPGAIVNLLQPKQFGWQVTDSEGRIRFSFAAAPPGGTIFGTVEHPTRRSGAFFAITQARSSDAEVQLLPLGRVAGRVTSNNGKPLEGAVVDGRFEHPALAEDLVLWRTLSNKEGEFLWAGAFPLVQNQHCAAQSQIDGVVQGPVGKSATFFIDSTALKDVGNLVVPDGTRSKSALGSRSRWYSGRLQCGTLGDTKKLRGTPAVVIYCDVEEAAMVIEALSVAKRVLEGSGLAFAVVVDGVVECTDAGFPVLKGSSPSAASTILVGRDGKIALECIGMPPMHAINQLLAQ